VANMLFILTIYLKLWVHFEGERSS